MDVDDSYENTWNDLKPARYEGQRFRQRGDFQKAPRCCLGVRIGIHHGLHRGRESKLSFELTTADGTTEQCLVGSVHSVLRCKFCLVAWGN
jgi:hypothetical protein